MPPFSSTSATSRLLAALVASLLVLTGCSTGDDPATPAPASEASSAVFPRTFTNADGTTTEIPTKPERIASTAASVTGTLLAIGAPVTASGSAGNGNFFPQWAQVARERDVANLWPAGKVNLEALHAEDPDLIVVAANGADSVKDQLTELRAIAPTIVVDYAGQTWEKLAEQLGTATGREAEAKKTVDDFEAFVKDAATKVKVPEGRANIVSYNGPGQSNPIAKGASAQGQVLKQLGFTIEEPDQAWHTQAGARGDFVFAAYENLTQLTAETTFVLSKDDAGAQAMAKDPVLANLPSVAKKQVYGLGANSFRVDMYSAREIVSTVVASHPK